MQQMTPKEIAAIAHKQAENATTFEQLKATVEAFTLHPLKAGATNTVFHVGNPQAPLLVIGEAPGEQEDLQAEPFCGRSGKVLRKLLEDIGQTQENTCITNGLYWRPPNNKTPTLSELTMVRPFVERFIALVNPKVLLFVGGSTAKFMLNTQTGITRLRHQWLTYENTWTQAPIATMCTLHPAFILRNPAKQVEMEADLALVKAKLAG
jgi:DNA polymerase